MHKPEKVPSIAGHFHRRRRQWAGGVALASVTIASLTAPTAAQTILGRASVPRLTSQVGAAPLTFAGAAVWGPSWSYNPWSPDYLGLLVPGLVLAPLAVQVFPTLTRFVPELATHWTIRGRTLAVQLRPGATWQGGGAVTSTDVYDTVLLDGTNGGVWNEISNVATPNPHTISFTLRAGVPAALAEGTILGIDPVPASVYGKFVSPSLKADEVAYYNKNAANPAAASKMPQYQAMTKAFQALSQFNPTNVVGDGPFSVTSTNTLEAGLAKSPSFWDAKAVHVSTLTELNSASSSSAYPEMYTGRADWTFTPIFPADLQRWLRTPGAHETLSAPQLEFVMTFNDSRYPLNMVKVRQALAYVIPRSKMISVTYGAKDAAGAPEPHPDGLTPGVESQYLTPSQIGKLNNYPVNPGKAAALLRSVGFRKTNGHWLMPNGKPFSLPLIVDSAFTDVISSFGVASNALQNFGIKSEVRPEPGATWGADQADGNFSIGLELPFNVDPLIEFQDVMGAAGNFTKPGARGLGFGPNANVPGLGIKNIPATIDKQAASVGQGPRMKSLVWDWARLVNKDVPYLQYGNKTWQMSYSTQHFVDWPSKRTGLWNLIGQNFGGGWLVTLERGYVRPKP